MTFIIAEIGVNWDGDFSLVKEMMKKSKEAGCDAVKFQAFNKNILGDHPQSERLLKSSISRENIERIDAISKEIGIEWICTPMYVGAVDFLDPYVKRYKIRTSNGKSLVNNQPSELFTRILQTNKEIIVSSETTPKNSKFWKHHLIKWLYCVPKYPCALSDLNFDNFDDFQGISNHCLNTLAPLYSVILGGNIVEVHVTNDKSKDYVDNSVSFDFKELRELIQQIHKFEKFIDKVKNH